MEVCVTINAIQNYVLTSYPSTAGKAAFGVCGAIAIESALIALKELGAGKIADASVNIGTAVFYGSCAANLIPGSAYVGSVMFTLYSIANCKEKDTYLTAMMIGSPIRFVAKEIVWRALEKIVFPILEQIAWALAKVGEFCGAILAKIPVPNHPIWIGVAIVGVGGAAYQIALHTLLK
jgi:hypothetical protein